MKIINEKGRLFGIINVIDLSVLLVLVLITGAVAFKVTGGNIATSSGGIKEITFVVKAPQKYDFVAQAFKEGDRLTYGNIFLDAEIASVRFEPAKISAPNAEGKLIAANDPVYNDIYLTIKARLNTNTPVLKLGNYEVRVGATYVVTTQRAAVAAFVQEINIPD
jgi:hypothetical protein